MSFGYGFLVRRRLEPVLIAVAAPLEAAAVQRGFGLDPAPIPDWRVTRLDPHFRLVQTGIGKVNATGAVARALERGGCSAVISCGIAGALPGSNLELGEVVLAEASAFADEGILTPTGFQTCAEMGFPLGSGTVEGNRVRPGKGAFDALSAVIERRGGRVGVIATVSTCSGTRAGAEAVVARTGAIAEAMEGAAVGLAVARMGELSPRRGVEFAEIRVISNTTGDRPEQRWEMKRALGVLAEIAGDLRVALGA